MVVVVGDGGYPAAFNVDTVVATDDDDDVGGQVKDIFGRLWCFKNGECIHAAGDGVDNCGGECIASIE